MFGHDDKDKDEKDKAELDNAAANGDQDNKDWQHPGTPIDDNDAADDDKSAGASDTVVSPSEENDDKTAPNLDIEADKPDEPAFKPSEPSSPAGGSADDLIDIKQEALGKLSPLVGHLDQSPEEKFRTLMMMIQASDDQSKIKEAYDAALEIDDEKERAQALLDIVNEINYFTQNPAKPE